MRVQNYTKNDVWDSVEHLRERIMTKINNYKLLRTLLPNTIDNSLGLGTIWAKQHICTSVLNQTYKVMESKID